MTVFHHLKRLLAEVFPFRFSAAKIQLQCSISFLLNFLSTSTYLFFSGPSKAGEPIFLLFFPYFPGKKRRCERNLESCLRQTIIFPLLLFNCSLLLKFHIIFIHKNCFKLFLSARVLDFEKYFT